MKQIILILILIISGILSNAQKFESEKSIYVSIIDYDAILNEIKNYVDSELDDWKERKFDEKISDYEKRVTLENYELHKNQYTKEKLNSIANEIIKLEITDIIYDPDNEIFKITFNGLPAIYINVPSENKEAEIFKNNLKQLTFYSPEYTLDTNDKQFILTHLNIRSYGTHKNYIYDSKDTVNFEQMTITQHFGPLIINFPEPLIPEGKEGTIEIGYSDVDINLPKTKNNNPYAFAVVIGNKNYEKTKNDDFAISDAMIIKNYLIEVLGFNESNIYYKENATKGFFEEMFGTKENPNGKLKNNIVKESSDVFIYYSGHGAPGLRDKKGYFVPVECDPLYVELGGYSQEILINNLAQLSARNITIIIDACFSGFEIIENIKALIPEVSEPIFMIENGILISSSQNNQFSSTYNEKYHGLFTYFFLKAIQDKNKSDANKDNKLTYQEIFNYICDPINGIPAKARSLYNIEQVPVIKGNLKNEVFIKF